MSSNGNEFLPNFTEHLVPLQEKGMIFLKKMGIIALALVLVVLIFFAATFSFLQYVAAFIPFLLLGVAFLVWYLWRFVSVEFEYTILQGEISFERIYGRRQRAKLYSASISKMEKIAPLNGKSIRAADISGVTREVFAASTRENPKTWYAVVAEENGEKTLLFFEVTEKAEKALRFYNGRAFLS